MHGLNGEDGTLQGLLELSGLAYTSCNVPASAVCMDKIVAKSVFIGLGLKTAEFVWFTAGEFERDAEAVLARAEEAVGYPCVVKPANLGSSIGISVCADRGALRAAVGTAAAFDRRILVERALSDFFELNCSVLGIEDDIKVSECERPAAWHEFLTFEDKYLGGGRKSRKPGGEACARGKPYKAGGGEACAGGGGGVKNCGGGGIGMHGLRREFPAKVGEGLRGRIRGAAAQIFRAINAKGVVRVDFLIDKKTETVYTNEVNTIPGSLSFYLWEREGVDFKHLIDRLIYFAECERDLKAGLRYAYKTDVIASAARGAGKAGKG
jgi:D-alanine-D-alanine ligase